MAPTMTPFLAAEASASRWLGTTWTELGLVVALVVAVYAAVIALTRLGGLRSFSQMSSFDFAMTIAIGSIMASVAVVPNVTLLNGLVALALLFAIQTLVAVARQRGPAEKVVDNTPALLYGDDGYHHDNMHRARVTESDLRAKLRENGVADLDDVLAIVLETTGTVSVMQGDGPLDERLLEGVRR